MPDVKMNYGSMEKMAKEFKAAKQKLEESAGQMIAIDMKLYAESALVGAGGTAFSEAIRDKLIPRMGKLILKMEELEQDIKGAVSATRDGVKTAQSRFK